MCANFQAMQCRYQSGASRALQSCAGPADQHCPTLASASSPLPQHTLHFPQAVRTHAGAPLCRDGLPLLLPTLVGEPRERCEAPYRRSSHRRLHQVHPHGLAKHQCCRPRNASVLQVVLVYRVLHASTRHRATQFEFLRAALLAPLQDPSHLGSCTSYRLCCGECNGTRPLP